MNNLESDPAQWEEKDEVKFIMSKKKDTFRLQIRAKRTQELFQKKRLELLSLGNNYNNISFPSVSSSTSTLISQNDLQLNDQIESSQSVKDILLSMPTNQQEIEDQLKKTCNDILAEYLRNEIDTPAMYDKMRLLRVYTQKVDTLEYIGQTVVESGVLNVLQEIIVLPLLNLKNLQQQAAYVLSNITYCNGDLIAQILNNNIQLIDVLVQLFKSSDYDLCTHAMYALANMAQEYLDVRDEALQRGVAEALVEKYELYKTKNNFIEQALWFIAIFSIRSHPYELIRVFLPILDDQLAVQSATNDNTRFIAMALKELSNGDEDKIQGVLDMKNIKLLISLATRSVNSVPLLIYQTISNLTLGNHQQISKLIDCGVLNILNHGFQKKSIQIKIEICQSINNLMCQDPSIIERVITHSELLEKIFSFAITGNFKYKRELIFALGNFSINGSFFQIENLRKHGLLSVLMNSFSYEDIELIESSLSGIYALLNAEQQHQEQLCNQQININNNNQSILMELEHLGLSSTMLELQKHPNNNIYKKVEHIITSFYEY